MAITGATVTTDTSEGETHEANVVRPFLLPIDTARRVLIDPFLTHNANFQKAGISLAQAMEGIRHLALTHGHEDHTGDVVTVCKDTGAPLLVVHELATYLAGQGVDRIDPGNTAARSITAIST